jgi:hypothetical protein
MGAFDMSQKHHKVAIQLWNTVYATRLPRNGARIAGFLPEAQEVFWKATQRVTRHGYHPALTDMQEVLLRAHVEKKVGSIENIAKYTADDADDFVKMLDELAEQGGKSRRWKRLAKGATDVGDAIGDALRVFSKGGSKKLTAYRKAYPQIATAMGKLQNAKNFEKFVGPILKRSKTLTKAVRQLADASSDAAGRTVAKSAFRSAAKRGGRKLVKVIPIAGQVVGAVLDAAAIKSAYGKVKSKEDEIAALREELKNADGAKLAEARREIEVRQAELEDLREWLDVEVSDAASPLPVGTVVKIVGDWTDERAAKAKTFLADIEQFRNAGQAEAYSIYEEALRQLQLQYYMQRTVAFRTWLAAADWPRTLQKRHADAAKAGVSAPYEPYIGVLAWRPSIADVEATTIESLTLVAQDEKTPTSSSRSGSQGPRWAVYAGYGKRGTVLAVVIATWELTADDQNAFGSAVGLDGRTGKIVVKNIDLSESKGFQSPGAKTIKEFRFPQQLETPRKKMLLAPFNLKAVSDELFEVYKQHYREWQYLYALQLDEWMHDTSIWSRVRIELPEQLKRDIAEAKKIAEREFPDESLPPHLFQDPR